MNRYSRFFVFFLAFTAISITACAISVNAQQTRVAYIDASKILKRMPEVKDAQTRLDQLTQSWTKDASEMQSDLERKQADFERRKLIMTDAERSSSELDIANLRKRHDDYVHQKFDENGGELYTQEAVFMRPAYEKLQNAIKEVAQDGNYDYVFDRSSKDIAILFSNTKYDLTIQVARKLGIESEILTTSLVPKKTDTTAANKPAPAKPGQTALPNAPQTPSNTPMTPGQGIMPTLTTPTTLTPGSPAPNPNPNPNPPPPPPTSPTPPPH